MRGRLAGGLRLLSHTVELVGADGTSRAALGARGGKPGDLLVPSALAWAPGLGLVVRDFGHLQVFATRGMVAMGAMSGPRVAWMVAVARANLGRR